jgi:hypothetical protein
VGGNNIGGIVLYMVLLWEGSILGGLWCILCYCYREQFWVNCCAHDVTVGGSNILGIVVHIVLLLEGANFG